MSGQLGFWSNTDRLAKIPAQGEPLEMWRRRWTPGCSGQCWRGALGPPPRLNVGRPPFDPVLKFRMLVLQSLHGLSLEPTEYLVRDRRSWMRFYRIGPEARVPNANTPWDFREALIARLDWAITAAGYLPRGGQILVASLVPVPAAAKHRRGKAQIREGRAVAEIWPEKLVKARQKDVDGP